MRTSYRLIIVSLFTLLLVGFSISESFAKNKEYIMTGKIAAIDMDYDTIMVEVPLGTQMFTVAGPLDSNVVLTKKGKPVSLDDFNIGESVSVRWRSTPKGHLILVVTAR